ncbi:Transmembrane protease serine 4 [Entomophthora muscae]|uniref:Transmembrane protease serine 4 n=1 Tax=Entomophthora muscae TaxID=34485 RepID=A0ACC2U8F6_9FUNG|nr:Transmembrane protease serine 4 [Entomophthora muscae]
MKLFLLVGLALGIQKLPNGIVGGFEVKPAFRYPWIVSLQKYGIHMCGGTLYNPSSVITAAHCFNGNLEKWTAHLHRHNLDKLPSDEDGHVSSVSKYINHPNYDQGFTKKYDVAVWKISGVPVHPIVLGSDQALVKDHPITVIGWGRVEENGKDSPLLLEAQLPIYNQTQCKALYTNLHLESQFCAGYPAGAIDACRGDSGGPAFITDRGQYYLVGVTSWGMGCARKNHPGVFTRIHQVKQFILDNSK